MSSDDLLLKLGRDPVPGAAPKLELAGRGGVLRVLVDQAPDQPVRQLAQAKNTVFNEDLKVLEERGSAEQHRNERLAHCYCNGRVRKLDGLTDKALTEKRGSRHTTTALNGGTMPTMQR